MSEGTSGDLLKEKADVVPSNRNHKGGRGGVAGRMAHRTGKRTHNEMESEDDSTVPQKRHESKRTAPPSYTSTDDSLIPFSIGSSTAFDETPDIDVGDVESPANKLNLSHGLLKDSSAHLLTPATSRASSSLSISPTFSGLHSQPATEAELWTQLHAALKENEELKCEFMMQKGGSQGRA